MAVAYLAGRLTHTDYIRGDGMLRRFRAKQHEVSGEGAVVVNNPLLIICRADKTGNRSTWLLGPLLP
jgi:hypothetical protein